MFNITNYTWALNVFDSLNKFELVLYTLVNGISWIIDDFRTEHIW